MTIGFPGYVMAVLLWLALIAFAALGGADFGAGIWDAFATGAEAKRQRESIVRAIGPIWEANAIWIVYFITGLWTVFPTAFSVLVTVLFIPLALALAGIVVRGAAFAYYTHFQGAVQRGGGLWERAFSVASVLAPFLLGAGLAAVASGSIRVKNGVAVHPRYFAPWLTPFALACGAFAVSLCAVLAAVYLAEEARSNDEDDEMELFRMRALVTGAITSVIGAIALTLAHFDAPRLFTGLLGQALPATIAAMIVGVATAALLWYRHFALARIAAPTMVGLIFVAWALSQMPYLIPPDVTLANSVAPYPTQVGTLIASIFGLPIILSSLWYLLYVFKVKKSMPQMTASQFMDSLREPSAAAKNDESVREDIAIDAPPPKSLPAQAQALKAKGKRAAQHAKASVTSGARQRLSAKRTSLTLAEALLALITPIVASAVQRAWYRRRLRLTPNKRSAYDIHAPEEIYPVRPGPRKDSATE